MAFPIASSRDPTARRPDGDTRAGGPRHPAVAILAALLWPPLILAVAPLVVVGTIAVLARALWRGVTRLSVP